MRLLFLPAALTATLGCASQQRRLQSVLAGLKPPITGFLRPVPQPYRVTLGSTGLSLQLHCLDPASPPANRLWGLRSITALAPASGGPAWTAWPDKQNAASVPARRLLAPILDSQPAEAQFTAVGLIAAALPGELGQTWSLEAAYDPQTELLHALTLSHVGDWLYCSVLPPWPEQPNIAALPSAPTAPPKPSMATIRHGHPIPADGYWKLRSDDPHYPLKAWRERQAPEPFFAGQKPSDLLIDSQNWRNTLVWTWIKPLDESGRKIAETRWR